MSIVNYIPKGRKNAITREELCEKTGFSDRKVRELIFQARREHVILNLQDGNGYFLPDEEDRELVKKFLEQETSRLKSIGWALKSARRFLENG